MKFIIRGSVGTFNTAKIVKVDQKPRNDIPLPTPELRQYNMGSLKPPKGAAREASAECPDQQKTPPILSRSATATQGTNYRTTELRDYKTTTVPCRNEGASSSNSTHVLNLSLVTNLAMQNLPKHMAMAMDNRNT